MNIESHKPASHEEWLALRRQDITASVAGALLGVHPKSSPFQLWAEKTGLVPETDDEETPAMKRGRRLEPVVIQIIREEHPTWGIKANPLYYRDPLCAARRDTGRARHQPRPPRLGRRASEDR